MLREESTSIDQDMVENAVMMFRKTEPLRMKIKKVEEKEQEVLQTKIVSPAELTKDIDLWHDAIQSELTSLLESRRLWRLSVRRRRGDWKRCTKTLLWCQASLSSQEKQEGEGK